MCNCRRVILLCPACEGQTGQTVEFRGHGFDSECDDIQVAHIQVPRENLGTFFCPHPHCSLSSNISSEEQKRFDDIRLEAQAAFQADLAAAQSTHAEANGSDAGKFPS